MSLYLVALVGIGMLSTTGMIISEDSFGPVSDNAAGIAEMSGEFTGEAERVMVSLDAVGNTTKAITKGVAIGSAVIAAVALFSSFIETIGSQLQPEGDRQRPLPGAADADQRRQPDDVHRPAHRRLDRLPLLLPGDPRRRPLGRHGRRTRCAVSSASTRASWTTPRSRSTAASSRICTAAAQRELATPALLAVLSPVIVGFGINYFALGAFFAATILTGQLMANFLSNSGGAWDNAKKYIEDGNHGGKGSESHKAAVIGDTVGDPFKDTAGPALNPLIKVMNLVSLLILPAVITLRHKDARFVIAGVALLILLAAIAFSKRSSGSIAEGPDDAASAPAREREPRGPTGRRPSPGGRGEARDMAKPLVIVESPAKAKTIARIPRAATMSSSRRSVTSATSRAAPPTSRAAYKGEAWARLGVDVDNDFKPLYVVSREKKAQVQQAEVARRRTRARSIWRQTRTAKASRSPGTSWRCWRRGSRCMRMVFHEITAGAIGRHRQPRDLDRPPRRRPGGQADPRPPLRLRGLAGALEEGHAKGLSAGRVQSVATRIVVERERERMRFRSASWWSVEGRCRVHEPGPASRFEATLVDARRPPVATGERLRRPSARSRTRRRASCSTRPAHAALAGGLEGATFACRSRRGAALTAARRRRRSSPRPSSRRPARKLRFSAQRTMQVAQRLYEQGYITYMRTDSTTLSDDGARRRAGARRAPSTATSTSRAHRAATTRKVKNAQEAHEAIRPAGETFRTPASVAGELHGDERRLYELVWQRTVASQMNDATGVTRPGALRRRRRPPSRRSLPTGTVAEFAASGTGDHLPGLPPRLRRGMTTNPTRRARAQPTTSACPR